VDEISGWIRSMKLKKKSLMLIFLFLLPFFPLRAKEKSISPNIKCLSCHQIKSISKAKLRINQEYFFTSVHVALRCTNCHPGMPDNIAESKIHTNHNKKKSGAFYYISPIVFWIISVTLLSLIFGVVIITIHWLLPRFIRKIKYKKNKISNFIHE
jgi:hypothetical protein